MSATNCEPVCWIAVKRCFARLVRIRCGRPFCGRLIASIGIVLFFSGGIRNRGTFDIGKVSFQVIEPTGLVTPVPSVWLSITNRSTSPIRIVGYQVGPNGSFSMLGAKEETIGTGVSRMRLVFSQPVHSGPMALVVCQESLGDQFKRNLNLIPGWLVRSIPPLRLSRRFEFVDCGSEDGAWGPSKRRLRLMKSRSPWWVWPVPDSSRCQPEPSFPWD